MSLKKMKISEVMDLDFFKETACKVICLDQFSIYDSLIKKMLFLDYEELKLTLKNELAFLFEKPTILVINKNELKSKEKKFLLLEEYSFNYYSEYIRENVINKISYIYDIMNYPRLELYPPKKFLGLFNSNTYTSYCKFWGNLEKNFKYITNYINEQLYLLQNSIKSKSFYQESEKLIEFCDLGLKLNDKIAYISNGNGINIGYYILKVKNINYNLYYSYNSLDSLNLRHVTVETEIIESSNKNNTQTTFKIPLIEIDGKYKVHYASLNNIFDAQLITTDLDNIKNIYKKLTLEAGISVD